MFLYVQILFDSNGNANGSVCKVWFHVSNNYLFINLKYASSFSRCFCAFVGSCEGKRGKKKRYTPITIIHMNSFLIIINIMVKSYSIIQYQTWKAKQLQPEKATKVYIFISVSAKPSPFFPSPETILTSPNPPMTIFTNIDVILGLAEEGDKVEEVEAAGDYGAY